MDIITEAKFLSFTFKQGEEIEAKGYPRNTVFIFECEQDRRFDIIGYNGKGDNNTHFWIDFKDQFVGVEASKESINNGFVLSEAPLLLNIDATPEITHDNLNYPDGFGIY